LFNFNCDGSKFVDRAGSNATKEIFRAWQHLRLSKIIPGNYTGKGKSTGTNASIGENVPEVKFRGAGYSIMTASTAFYDTDSTVTIPKGNFLWMGTDRGDDVPSNSVVLPREARNIDNKIDGSGPHSGSVITERGTDDRNVSGKGCLGNSGTSAFILSQTQQTCRMKFRL
jgi:hypothetical protein